MEYGLRHRSLDGITAIGVDEVQFQKGHRYLTVALDLEIPFDGSGTGEDEKSGDCDSDAQLSATGDIDDGQLHVTVTDGSGDTVFDETYGPDDEFTSKGVNGNEGRWTLRVERMRDDVLGDDFKGNYVISLNC